MIKKEHGFVLVVVLFMTLICAMISMQTVNDISTTKQLLSDYQYYNSLKFQLQSAQIHFIEKTLSYSFDSMSFYCNSKGGELHQYLNIQHTCQVFKPFFCFNLEKKYHSCYVILFKSEYIHVNISLDTYRFY